MIDGFEITHELKDDELNHGVPMVWRGLLQRTKENPATSTEIAKGMTSYLGRKITGVRVRKMIHYLRVKHQDDGENICASSTGYWVSSDPDELRDSMSSMMQRVRSVHEAAKAIEGSLKVRNKLREGVKQQLELY